MFPTLSSLTEYLFGFGFQFPVQTFGLFVALAFLLSYKAFSSEFKRKEALGWIRPFTRAVTPGKSAAPLELIFYGVLGFVLGFKVAGCVLSYGSFVNHPLGFIFSLKGNAASGMILAALLIYGVYRERKKEMLSPPEPVIETVHPYELMPSLLLGAAFWGFLGAKIFSCLENPDIFMLHPLSYMFSASGWTFYGGLIFGGLAFLFIGYKHGMKLIHLVDIGSPGMLVAYGVGRIGCHLSGDGDWGIASRPKPSFLTLIPDWMWSFRFPHNSLNEGELIAGCTGLHCMQLQQGVYPTSFYESVLILFSFFLIWMFRKNIHTPGLMFVFYLLIVGVERFLIESIKVNRRFDLFTCFISQAQLIAACFILGGISGLFFILIKSSKSAPGIPEACNSGN